MPSTQIHVYKRPPPSIILPTEEERRINFDMNYKRYLKHTETELNKNDDIVQEDDEVPFSFFPDF